MEQSSPPDHGNQPPYRTRADQWADRSDAQLLKVYVYYRTLLSSILLLMFSSALATSVLGTSNPVLFAYTAFIYTAANLLVLLIQWRRRFAPRTEQIVAILLVDILAITLMAHASEGMNGNLAYLLLICVAAGSIFLRGTAALALAGLTTILVLTESLFSVYLGRAGGGTIFAAGIFGVLIFATAFAFGSLSARIRRSSLEAIAQAEHAAYLQRLSQLIVERMRTGIVVANKDGNLVLINRGAKTLLNIPLERRTESIELDQIEPLYEQFRQWRAHPHRRSPYLRVHPDSPEVRVSFAQLEQQRDSDILIFVEDNRVLTQEAQQLKLASLGRLTASIAHEVRNPLGAISHAAQLLGESEQLSSDDRRLGQIIQSHSNRVNHIIENVLELSRRRTANSETLDLSDWLEGFAHEYQQSNRGRIAVHCHEEPVRTRMDPSQLQQVLTNLCDNGLRHAEQGDGDGQVVLAAGVDTGSELPYIEVIDEGPGVPEENLGEIFEPFFSTESSGSGLGLYISRELCEANQATLDYKRTPEGKSCFRINFAHPNRVF